MRLNEAGMKNREDWEQAGYALPRFNRQEMIQSTKENPEWIHFGAGNIFRAFQANVVQKLLNSGVLTKGLIVAEGFDYEIIEKLYAPYDNYGILATLKADGTIEKTVVGSIAEALVLDSEREAEFERLKEIFCKPSLQMATFTITEKGYSLVNGTGALLSDVASDFAQGPGKPASYMGKVTALLYARFCAGRRPMAMVSMDNCSHNGTKLKEAVQAFAGQWAERGLAEKEFAAYVENPDLVSFPWTMIDKITPRPDASVQAVLKQDGVEGMDPVVTGRNTYAAPFVNAEECEYLVIEDRFPGGRPMLELGGFIFTDQSTVDKVEKMKVCTCLNPLHTALAVFGCLLGYDLISKEMKDDTLRRLVEGIGYREGLPVVVNPGILDPEEFIDTVLKVRIPNPFMPDTPQRIATDTSQKLAIRYGETIKAYLASPDLKVSDLKLIPVVLAGWLRYLLAVDDRGEVFELSPDPLLNTLLSHMGGLKLGQQEGIEEAVKPLLSDEAIFGVDLYQAGLAEAVCCILKEMLAGPGAVRRTLEKYVGV